MILIFNLSTIGKSRTGLLVKTAQNWKNYSASDRRKFADMDEQEKEWEDKNEVL